MNRITQKLDLERVALDAYSVVWEPSRKQVRDHQRATKAAVAAVLLHLSEAWSAVPEYQTNGHVQQTVGEFGGRLLIAASDLIGAGENDDLHALLSGEDRSEPTPAPREPRVWRHGVHTDIDQDVSEVAGKATGRRWQRMPGKQFVWTHAGLAYSAGTVLYVEDEVSEVVAPKGTP